MRQFKKQGRLLYLAESRESEEHYVPEVNWEEYIECRLNKPRLCKLFDTVEAAQQAALSIK